MSELNELDLHLDLESIPEEKTSTTVLIIATLFSISLCLGMPKTFAVSLGGSEIYSTKEVVTEPVIENTPISSTVVKQQHRVSK